MSKSRLFVAFALALTVLPSAFADSAKIQMKFTATMRESFKETSDHSWISTYEKTIVEGYNRAWENGVLVADQSLNKTVEGPSASGKEISLEVIGGNVQRKTGNGPVKQVPVKLTASSLKIKKGEIDGLFGITEGVRLNCSGTSGARMHKSVKTSDYKCVRMNSTMDCEVTISVDAGCKARM